MDQLVKFLISGGLLKDERIIAAFRLVDRKDFVPRSLASSAYFDEALPIGEGQTISEPGVVAFMLSLLAPRVGDCLVDIGYGSGWQTALLAALVGERGKVYAMERLDKLCEVGKENVKKYKPLFPRIRFYCQNAKDGLPLEAKMVGGFDGLIAAAEVKEVPLAWRDQLKIGGRLIYPRRNSIYKETKLKNNNFKVEIYQGFVFVPFLERG